MGLFDKEKLEGMLNNTKNAVKSTTSKVSQSFGEGAESMRQYNEASKKLKAPVDGAIIRYGVTYRGGLPGQLKEKSGEIGLNIMDDCFYFRPTQTTAEWFEEMAIPYKLIKSVELKKRTISNTEMLLSSSSDLKSMEQINNIEIIYMDHENSERFIRVEMLTGVSIYGQAKVCVEFMDVLRNNKIFDKFMRENKDNKEIVQQNSNPSGDEIMQQIEKLSQLHEKGIITDEEFAGKKANLLDRI